MTTHLLDSEIKYCRETRDYDILIAGVICASAANYDEAEAKRTRLLSERRDEGAYAPATELDGGAIPEGTDEDDYSDVGPAYHAPGYCGNCGGPHHVQRCGELQRAMRSAPIPAVRTTARQWLADDWRRDALARQWSARLRNAMDASAESYAEITKTPV